MTFPTLSRRIFTAAVLCSAAFTAGAQDKYLPSPSPWWYRRRLVVPMTRFAGGGAKLGEQLGQSVIVENRPGAGGTLATGTTARARNDGYTLLLTADSAHVIGPALYKNPGFDPVKDFAPVARWRLRAMFWWRTHRSLPTPWPKWWPWPRPAPASIRLPRRAMAR